MITDARMWISSHYAIGIISKLKSHNWYKSSSHVYTGLLPFRWHVLSIQVCPIIIVISQLKGVSSHLSHDLRYSSELIIRQKKDVDWRQTKTFSGGWWTFLTTEQLCPFIAYPIWATYWPLEKLIPKRLGEHEEKPAIRTFHYIVHNLCRWCCFDMFWIKIAKTFWYSS